MTDPERRKLILPRISDPLPQENCWGGPTNFERALRVLKPATRSTAGKTTAEELSISIAALRTATSKVYSLAASPSSPDE
jgi:hypothetical protein